MTFIPILPNSVSSIEYGFNSGTPGSQNYDRLRTLQGLGYQPATISAGGTAGTNTATLNVATGLLPGQAVLLTGGTEEWVYTDPSYTAGSTSVIFATAIVNSSHTGAAWNTTIGRGPGAATFLMDGVSATGLVLNTGSPATGILAQGDNLGNLKVSQQGTVSVTQGLGANAGTAWRMMGDFLETSGLSAGSLNADLVPSTDVSAYRWWSIHTFGTWSGTLTFQGSNDNSNWIAIQVTSANSSAAQGSTSGSPGIFHGSVVFRYLRIRMTSYSSGTANGILELFTTPAFSMQMTASQAGTWTVQPGNTQNTTPWLFCRSAVSAYSLASTTTTGSTQNSGDISVGPYTEISLDINTTAQAGTSPTIQYFYERKGADGIYYVLWQSAILTAATNTLSTSIGAGMAYNQSLGSTGRLRWVVGGSATPTFTHSINLQGK